MKFVEGAMADKVWRDRILTLCVFFWSMMAYCGHVDMVIQGVLTTIGSIVLMIFVLWIWDMWRKNENKKH